jgi:hypothetical protein
VALTATRGKEEGGKQSAGFLLRHVNFGTWAYKGGKRDLRLDLLRGFAAFAMIADHIGGERSWLYAVTGGDKFVVSAAEAFVFISGVVMGMVYGNVIVRQGIGQALVKALNRAWALYLVTVGVTLGFVGLSSWLRSPWALNLAWHEVPNFVLDIITLRRTYFLADIPMMYTVLLLGAGPVILLLWHRQTVVVLAASWGLWALWQFSPQHAEVPWHIIDNKVFNISPWQVLFVTGIVIGFHRESIERFANHLPHREILALLGAATAIVLFLYIVQIADLSLINQNHFLARNVFNKPDLQIGRLIVFFFLAIFAFAMTTVCWEPIRKATGWLLLPLGQNALTAYSIHVFLVAFVVYFRPEVVGDPTKLVNTLIQLTGVVIVWGMVVLEPAIKGKLILLFIHREQGLSASEAV